MEWISVKEKPKEWCRVIMQLKNGQERWGVYDPESWLSPWIIENYADPFEMPIITHYKILSQ